MTSKPEPVADERLLHAHDLAVSALREITAADSIGPPAGYAVEDDGVVSLRFHTRLAGYPGWHWTVSVAVVDGSEPTVLEAELLPGEGALLAPDWVPWATRLAEYQAAQVAAAAAGDQSDDDEDLDDDELDDDESDDDEDDESDDDEEPQARLHAGDLDGVDIDELDEGADGSDDSDDDEDLDADEDPDDDADEDSDDEDASDDEDDDERERSY